MRITIIYYTILLQRNVRKALELLQGEVLDYFIQGRQKMQEDMMYV